MADYIIKQGDTLSAIAKANNTTVESLAKANEIADPNKIIAGATLRLPGADINASEVQSGAPTIIPPETPVKEPTKANAISEYTTQEQERINKEKAAAQASMGTTTGGYAGLIEEAGKRPTIDTETKRAQELQESGATELQKQVATQNTLVATIKGEREKLDIQEQNEIDALEKSGVTRGAIDRERAVIQRKYASQKALKNAELSAEAAVLSAMQGNYTMAKQVADDAVNDYTYDYQQNVKTFDTLFSLHADWINELSKDEQTILKTAAQNAQDELDKVTEEKKDVSELMIKYNQFGAGITLDDTVESASKKASGVSNIAGAQWIGSADTGYKLVDTMGNVLKTLSSGGTSGLSKTQIEDIAADMATIASQASREEAEKLLNQNKSAMILRYGQSGYDQIASEIDRVFPKEEEVTTESPNWFQNIFSSTPTTNRTITGGANKGKTMIQPGGGNYNTSIISKLFGE